MHRAWRYPGNPVQSEHQKTGAVEQEGIPRTQHDRAPDREAERVPPGSNAIRKTERNLSRDDPSRPRVYPIESGERQHCLILPARGDGLARWRPADKKQWQANLRSATPPRNGRPGYPTIPTGSPALKETNLAPRSWANLKCNPTLARRASEGFEMQPSLARRASMVRPFGPFPARPQRCGPSCA